MQKKWLFKLAISVFALTIISACSTTNDTDDTPNESDTPQDVNYPDDSNDPKEKDAPRTEEPNSDETREPNHDKDRDNGDMNAPKGPNNKDVPNNNVNEDQRPGAGGN